MKPEDLVNWIEGKDFEMVIIEGQEHLASIKILTGFYKDTIITYDNVKINKTETDQHPTLTYDFGLTQQPMQQIAYDTDDFKHTVSAVLTAAINNHMSDSIKVQ